MTRAEAIWHEAELELRAEVSKDEPLDPGVLELVVALRLLGFPTIGSCEGHEEQLDALPFVGCRYRLAGRFERDEADGAPNRRWLDPSSCNERERTYLAAVTWRWYRPLALQLRELLAEFYLSNDSNCRCLHVRANHWGLTLEPSSIPSEIELLGSEQAARVAHLREETRSFGSFLHQRLTASTA